jgi:putative transposase
MPRRPRISTGGYAFHVLNRAVGRQRIFRKADDYLAFEKVFAEVYRRLPVRILGYCLMPNHWHIVLWPEQDGELSEFMRLLTVTHTQRWHAHHHSAGTGPLYQGRFKSFPVQREDHLLTVLRYVERNPLRAKLVERAEQWPWSSLAKHHGGTPPDWLHPVDGWPARRREDWLDWVNHPQTEAEEAAVLTSIRRGRPYGTDRWVARAAKTLNLESTLRPRGRPQVRKRRTNIKDSRPL